MAPQSARLGPLALSRSATDRAGHRRLEPGLLDSLRADPATRVLRVAAGRTPVVTGEAVMRPEVVAPDDAADDALWLYLGRDDAGAEYLAALEDEPEEHWMGLREVGTDLDDAGAGLLTTAVALSHWHATHTHCPRCGTPTRVESAGWTRRCPADDSEHYPRTDSAIIVAVLDDEGRILLGHNRMWPEGRYSTLAGFVEPGESFEAAVRREVHEESGVVVGEVTYLGSQPWPFPASLMVGCSALAVDTTIRVDGEEILDARWFTQDEVRAEVEAGELLLPGGVSIAHRLVESWYGGPLPVGPREW